MNKNAAKKKSVFVFFSLNRKQEFVTPGACVCAYSCACHPQWNLCVSLNAWLRWEYVRATLFRQPNRKRENKIVAFFISATDFCILYWKINECDVRTHAIFAWLFSGCKKKKSETLWYETKKRGMCRSDVSGQNRKMQMSKAFISN